MFRSLLVPLDGSPFGEHALPLALLIASRAGARLDVVHVHEPGADRLLTYYTLDPRVREAEQAYLDGIARRLTAAAPVEVRPLLLGGEPVAALQEHAAAAKTDLVVLATHGRGPLSRFWIGSVADALVRTAAPPVLLVRPQDAAIDLAHLPVLKKVLVPLDGSELAEHALDPAVAVGRLTGAEFTLFQAVEAPAFTEFSPNGPGQGGRREARGDEPAMQAEAYLQVVARRLREHSVPARICLRSGKPAAAAILDQARSMGADLIALETHGRGGLPRLVLGSVADKVVRGSLAPVLVHRSAR